MRNLVDSHGRRIRKLRLSLTDKCNLRCHYCMPIDATFMDESRYLTPEEMFKIVGELCDSGLEELRITGGEPLMRKSFDQIVERIGTLPLKKIGMTTNAILLDRHLDHLLKHRVLNLNISLDSLDAATFKAVTRGNHLDRVLRNIDTASKAGFKVKINVVAMRGINDEEVHNFVTYSEENRVEVRFLELMRIGHALGEQSKQFISAKELISKIEAHHVLTPVARDFDSTSFNYTTAGGAQIGFIASETRAFCGQCSRWRLSADGIMRACLLKDDGIDFKNKSADERRALYPLLLGMKPLLRPTEVAHQMNRIGG